MAALALLISVISLFLAIQALQAQSIRSDRDKESIDLLRNINRIMQGR